MVSEQQRLLLVTQGLSEEERVLTLQNYVEFVCSGPSNIHLPLNTVTPSEQLGMTLEQERLQRRQGALYVKHSSILLRLSAQTCACALSMYHRYYYSQSFQSNDVLIISMASLFLAAKIEETPRKYKDVVSVFDIVKQQFLNQPLQVFDLKSYKLIDIKEKLMDAERMLIKTLGFEMQMISRNTTHKHLVAKITQLGIDNQDLIQQAWTLANDSYLGPICVLFDPDQIAIACLELAARIKDIPLPENLESANEVVMQEILRIRQQQEVKIERKRSRSRETQTQSQVDHKLHHK